MGRCYKKKREGLEKNTVIVFLSEHGEMLGDNGVFNKVMPSIESFNDIVLNFPLLIRHPNIKNVKNINGLVQIVDIMPTLFDMLGIKDSRNSARQGGSFYNYLNKGGAVNKFVYSGARRSIDSFFFKGMVSTESIRGHKFKFLREKVVDIDTGVCIKERNAFYDIVGDVDQVKNIYNNNIDLANNYNAKIDEWIERIKK